MERRGQKKNQGGGGGGGGRKGWREKFADKKKITLHHQVMNESKR